jgi:translocation and assembly module TamB
MHFNGNGYKKENLNLFMRKVLKIFMWIILSFIFLVIGLLVFTQTPWFRSIVINKALVIANDNINGIITVDKLKGNFFTWIELENVTVKLEDGETILSVERVGLRYGLMGLLSNKVLVRDLILEKPLINLRQDKDSVWNFTHLFAQEKVKVKTESKELGLAFKVGNFLLSEGSVTISSTDSLIPDRVENLNLLFKGSFAKGELDVYLMNLSFLSHQPDLILKSFQVKVTTDFKKWNISDFLLVTDLNRIQSNEGYARPDEYSVDLTWPEVHVSEFAFIIPDFSFIAQPDLSLKVEVKDDVLNLDVTLVQDIETLNISGYVTNFKSLLSDSLRHTAGLNLQVDIQNFIPDNWIEMEELPLLLNASIHLSGNGLKYESEPLIASGNLRGTEWEDYLLEKSDFHVTYSGGNTVAKTIIGGDFGELEANVSLNVFQPKGPFKGVITTNNIALHMLLPESVDSTIVSVYLEAEGEGIGSDWLSLRFNGLVTESVAEYIRIDSLLFRGLFSNNHVQLDTAYVTNSSLTASVHGVYDLKGDFSGVVKGIVRNTDDFAHYFTQPLEWAVFNFDASFDGRADSIGFNLLADADDLKFDTIINIKRLDLKGNGMVLDKRPDIETSLLVSNASVSGNAIDSLRLHATLKDSLWQADLHAMLPESMELRLESTGNLAKTMEIFLKSLEFVSPYAHLELTDGPSAFVYGDSILSLSRFNLIDQRDSLFRFRADGLYTKGDSLRLDARVQGFNMEMLSNFGVSNQYMKGYADLDLHIEGDRRRFMVDGSTTLSDLELAPLAISDISANLKYYGDSAKVYVVMYNEEGDSLTVNAVTPLTIQLSDSLVVSWPQTLKAAIVANKTRLGGFFLEIPGADQPNAILTLNLDVYGHVKDPHITGVVDITNGQYSLPKYGINYRDLRLKASIDGNEVQLDSLFTRHRNGTLLAQGKMVMDSTIFSGVIQSSDVRVRANQFYLVRHRDFEVQVDANVFFQDEAESSKFGGNITILRSSFNLPALIDLADDAAVVNEPLLVQALNEAPDREILEEEGERIEAPQLELKMMDQLTGSIRLNVPRNTWIRSPDMQMELFGNLDVVKNSNVFELFGTLGIHRGYYTLYGKKLIIQEGVLTFSGGEMTDPLVNLRALYVFRSPDRLKRELMLQVSGKATDPEISFELDRQPIPEADAMAYLLFGQPFDELNYGNQEGVSSAVPSRFLTGVISSQLSKTIGSTFNLDMIEIDAGDNWQNTTFMVGKYITNNLFVTYQRSFGQAESDAISPEIITLEYELHRRLSLRLMQGEAKDSGIDLILKFEK